MTVNADAGGRIEVSSFEEGDLVTLEYYATSKKGTKSIVGEVVDVGLPSPHVDGSVTIKTESGEIRTAHANSRVTNHYRKENNAQTVGYTSTLSLVSEGSE